MGLRELYSKWAKIDFLALAEKTLLEMDEYIAQLNRNQLSDKGVRADGTDITPEYTELTELLKRPKSGISGITSHVTLYDSGSFHKSIVADIYQGKLLLDATDSKTNELIDKYGEVLGLTKESIVLLQEKFRPIYVANIEKALQ